MNFVEYVDYLENRYQITLPNLYKQLAKDGMLDWQADKKNWRNDIYPKLLKNPPLFLHTYECEIPSPDELLSYRDEFLPTFDNKDWYYLKPEFQDCLVLFATCGNGDAYAFYYADDKKTEPMILRICHDKESEFVAKNLQDFIVYKLLEIAKFAEEDEIDEFRHQLLTQLESHRPYLTQSQADNLFSIYQSEFKTDDFGEQVLLDNSEFNDWINRLIPFNKQGDEIVVFEFDFKK